MDLSFTYLHTHTHTHTHTHALIRTLHISKLLVYHYRILGLWKEGQIYFQLFVYKSQPSSHFKFGKIGTQC